MTLRVLMVTRETGPDRKYGLGRSLLPVVEALRAQDVDARYFCQDDLTGEQLVQRDHLWQRIQGFAPIRHRPEVLAIARAWLERLQVGAAAADVARAEGCTHVHAHDPWIAAGVAWRLWRTPGPRVHWGVTQHGFGSYSRATHDDGLTQGPSMQAWMRRIERSVLSRASWVIAPTRRALDAVADDLRVASPPAHWHVVPHAKPAVEPGSDATRAEERAALGWQDDEFVVLSVGRLAPLKCFDRVIEACARQDDPRLRFAILGGGDEQALRSAADALGFGAQLRIESVDDVRPWLHAADLYVSASATESFGMANLEALCAGLPAICSAVGGVPEVMGDAAWLVPNDTATLARCIGTLRTDANARRRWSARALARAQDWPRADEIARRHVEIYRSAQTR